MSKIKAKNTLYNDPRYDVVVDSRMLEQHLKEKDQQIADLEAKLAESEKLTERLQQIVDKLRDKEFAGETLVNAVNSVYEPLYQGKCNEVEELKQQLHDLPKKIVEEIKDKIPEIGGMKCEIIIDDSLTLNTLLDTILKKYGGGK